MDGTGDLLIKQAGYLNAQFDTCCLTIPPTHLGSWEVLTQQVLELIHHELNASPDREVYLCGESFGACLAIKLALHSPHLFSRIILINPASSFRRALWLTLGGSLTRWLPQPCYQITSVGLVWWLANWDRVTAGDRQALLQAVQSVPQQTSAHRITLLCEFSVSPNQLKQLAQPVWLIASAADHLLPSVEEAHWLAQHLPDNRIVVLPHSGHACLLEAGINLYEILREHRF
jgi:pimeloyl-ACP methyl ester carboxylesterase